MIVLGVSIRRLKEQYDELIKTQDRREKLQEFPSLLKYIGSQMSPLPCQNVCRNKSKKCMFGVVIIHVFWTSCICFFSFYKSGEETNANIAKTHKKAWGKPTPLCTFAAKLGIKCWKPALT